MTQHHHYIPVTPATEFDYSRLTGLDLEEIAEMATIAEAIGGEVWNSGGGIHGVRVQMTDSDIFFGFADGTLGWDYSTNDGDFIGGGSTDLTPDQTPEVIARCQEVIANNEYDTMTAQGHTYRAGDAVIYSVYPSVANGTGVVTDDLMGIRSTGETLAEVTKMGLGDFCEWWGLYDVRPA
tara:strand:+ start:62 stop:601 length:540 start_codon:yes stop_codon:yes gene_type:complete